MISSRDNVIKGRCYERLRAPCDASITPIEDRSLKSFAPSATKMGKQKHSSLTIAQEAVLFHDLDEATIAFNNTGRMGAYAGLDEIVAGSYISR